MNEINSLLDAFCQLLINLSRQEKKIEIVKEMLCQSPDFEPYTTFKRLDRHNKNFIDCLDVNVFFEKNNIHIDTNTIFNTIFHRYCENGEMTYLDFLKIVLPSDHPNLRTIVSQRPAYNLGYNDFLNDEIEYTLAKLLEAEIECYCNVEEEKRLIHLTSPKLEAIINFIDIDSKNYIDFTDLSEFFNKRHFFPYEEELISILKRIDTNDDGILDPGDFFLLFQFVEKSTNSNENDIKITKNKIENFEKTNNSFKNNENNKSTPRKRIGSNIPIRKSISPLKGQNLGSGKKEVVKLENYPIFKNYKERKALEAFNNALPENFSERHEYHLNVKNKENYGKTSERLESNNAKEKSLNESNLERSQRKNTKINEEKIKETKLFRNKFTEKDINEEDDNFKKKYIKTNQIYNDLELNILPLINDNKTNKITIKLENPHKFSNDLKLQEKARKFLNNFADFINNLETKRIDLVLRPDFNIVDLFSFFDPDSKGFLLKENIDSFFCKNPINLDKQQLAFLLFRKYDKNDLGIIKFSEFTELFCPHSEELMKLINKRKAINHDSKFTYGELFSSETRSLINEILVCFYENEEKIEEFKIRDILEARKVFKLINKRKNGYIDKKELSEFIVKSENEVNKLLEKLDFDKDGRLSLEDFLVNISA